MDYIINNHSEKRNDKFQSQIGTYFNTHEIMAVCCIVLETFLP